MVLDIYLHRRKDTNDDGSFTSEGADQQSAIHPHHLFRMGYFRSSYNSMGFNNLLRIITAMDLYSIFGNGPGEGAGAESMVVPDWEQALLRAQAARTLLSNSDIKHGPVLVQEIVLPKHGSMRLPESPQQAMQLYKEEMSGESFRLGSYRNYRGLFFGMDTLDLRALMKGTDEIYMVTESRDTYTWLYESLDIIEETCQWVMRQKDIERYYLYWSA